MPKPKGKASAKQPAGTSTYAPKDIVLGKVRGYPAWPGWVVDPADAPPKVKAERPGGHSGKTSGGFSLVQFFPAGDFAWLGPKDISRLKSHEIDSYINEPTKRNGDLLSAYRVASNPQEWQAGRPAQGDHDDDDADEDADGEIDELASEPMDGKRKRKAPASKKGGKKHKKDAESEDESEPPAKKAKKASKKGKDDGDKKDVDAEGEADAEVSKDKKALEVRDWRHRLQKLFLSPKVPVKESDLPTMDTLFKTVENYDEITIEQLTFSKIGKVMRHINALSDDKMPAGADAQYKFRERAKTLVDRWHQVLNGPKEETIKNGHVVNEESKPANGDVKMEGSAPADAKSDTMMDETTPAPATNGIAVEGDSDAKMEEDKKPDLAIAIEAQQTGNALVEDAFLGDLTMDMSS